MKWRGVLVTLTILALGTLGVLAKPVQVGFRTGAFSLDLALSYQGRSGIVGKEPLISEVAYPSGAQTIIADLYRPDDQGQHPGLILGHGAFEEGKDDWRMRLMGKSFGRNGYVALIPHLPNLALGLVLEEDVEALIAGFQYLSEQDFIDGGRIGLGGFCLSAPLVVLAAEDPRISRNVRVISSWGGYYEIRDWIRAVLTETCIYKGQTKPWKPDRRLEPGVRKELILLSPNPSDRECLEAMLEGQGCPTGGLSPSGQATYELLTNRDPERVDLLWSKLDPQMKEALANVSPATKIDQLQTKVVIIHALGDSFVPSVESQKLADAIQDKDKVNLTIFRMFEHVDPNELLRVRLSNIHHIVPEAARFYLYMYRVLYQL